MTHAGLANLAGWLQAGGIGVGAGRRVLQFALGRRSTRRCWELCVALLARGGAGGGRGRAAADPAAAGRAAGAAAGDARAASSPSLLAALDAGGRPARRAAALVVGGEALRARRLAARLGGVRRRRWSTRYGPTETTVAAPLRGEPRQAGARAGRRSGGRWPIPGCSCWTSGWARCRPGWPGSCTWPGAGLARGYLGRPG